MRPSSILAIKDELAAYCLDEACFIFGAHIQGELETVQGKDEKQTQAQRQRLLEALLSDNPDARFATPVATR